MWQRQQQHRQQDPTPEPEQGATAAALPVNGAAASCMGGPPMSNLALNIPLALHLGPAGHWTGSQACFFLTHPHTHTLFTRRRIPPRGSQSTTTAVHRARRFPFSQARIRSLRQGLPLLGWSCGPRWLAAIGAHHNLWGRLPQLLCFCREIANLDPNVTEQDIKVSCCSGPAPRCSALGLQAAHQRRAVLKRWSSHAAALGHTVVLQAQLH